MSKLDDMYREAGWGRIVDAALNIRPQDAELETREVAKFAHAQIQKLTEENTKLRQLVGTGAS